MSNRKIFFTLFLAVLVTTTGVGLVAPLLPVYAHELGAGSFQIGLIFGAFSLTRSLFVPYFGRLSDRKGKKGLLSAGLFLYFIISLSYAASKDIWTLILLRLAQGFSSAMILPVAQAYVGIISPEHKEGRIMGLFNLSLYIGLSIGPLLGGVVKDMFNIQVSFLCMAAMTLAGFLLCLLFLPSEAASAKKDAGAGNMQIISYFTLIKSPANMSLFLFRLCFTLCIGITWAFIPVLASTRLGLSSSAIGVVVMINVLISGLLQAPMGILADKYSKKFLVTAGGVLGIISILYLNVASSFAGVFFANALLGLAGGFAVPSIMALGVIEGRRINAMGAMMGLLALAHSLGMLVGPLLAGALIDLTSFEDVFSLGAVIIGVGTIVFRRFAETR
ncbi:Transporter, major facilitator family protein [uncultured Desulfobacterium sp.]|uniref:Transporter, major facilitator family protein n=1 Tax=uncultured Desulfobacterium sp. TaxID=201089 RepID=A0A445MVX3_9BACT|nr:Transporter, major facilitator family protein [uncultured Desulfobacterium sp.]